MPPMISVYENYGSYRKSGIYGSKAIFKKDENFFGCSAPAPQEEEKTSPVPPTGT